MQQLSWTQAPTMTKTADRLTGFSSLPLCLKLTGGCSRLLILCTLESATRATGLEQATSTVTARSRDRLIGFPLRVTQWHTSNKPDRKPEAFWSARRAIKFWSRDKLHGRQCSDTQNFSAPSFI